MPINRSKPVLVYRNLRHGRKSRPLYSVCQDGRVVSHVHSIMLRDARFIVRESGRQRVLKENRKNVHAFIKGYVTSSGMGTDKFGRLPVQVVYNPYDVDYPRPIRMFSTAESHPDVDTASREPSIILSQPSAPENRA